MSRLLSTGSKLLRHTVPAILKPLRVLWNEMIGFVFLALAVLVGVATYNKFQAPGEGQGNLVVALMGGSFTLLLLYLGWSSFRRAKHISRS
jgi:hypothetical protein